MSLDPGMPRLIGQGVIYILNSRYGIANASGFPPVGVHLESPSGDRHLLHTPDTLINLDKDGDIVDLQRGHTINTANKYYGIEIPSHPDIPPNIFQQFEGISEKWAWVVGVSSLSLHPQQPDDHRVQSLPPLRSSPPETNDSSYLALQTVNQQIRQGLQRLYGPQGSFRSDTQELAIRIALAMDQDLIVVLPTGAGKSLIFQLPCQIEAGYTTVLVVPLKVLVWQFGMSAHFASRCKSSNLNAPLYLLHSC
jgi:hypothetical protein